jgi:SAM-dependent methyltransferase
MGELFRQIQPEAPLPWTGERMVTGLTGAIEAEHYHRYFLARELCRGKDVLDVASGEGYGSAFLAQTARSVVGVELDPASVEHAAHEYRSANLRYSVGEATKLPLDDRSVDAVVSFETIEHLSDHVAFLAEVKRVLRPGGFLIISTPDMNVYSAPGTDANPYHVRELTESEFREVLGRAFHKVSLVRQRGITGSVVLSDGVESRPDNTFVFEQRDSKSFEADHKLLRAPFLIAVASDRDVPSLGISLYVQTVNVTDIAAEVKAELERLRAVEQNAREQGPAIAKALNDAAAVPALQAELERLRKMEVASREHAAVVARLEIEFERTRRDLAASREEAVSLTEDRDQAQDELSAARSKLDASMSLTRQQSLTSQRSMSNLISVRQELDQYKSHYQQAAGLLIPLRVRRALPEPVKTPLRAIKRALRSLTRRTP